MGSKTTVPGDTLRLVRFCGSIHVSRNNWEYMLQSLFRAASATFDARGFANRHDIADEDVWVKGQEGTHGPRHDSGVCLLVADSEELLEHLQQLEEFILDFDKAIRELGLMMIPCRIDCGLTVGEKEHFTRSFTLSPTLMITLGELGIEFTVSAYPCSD